jgi:tyrosyl-tRNA synthetase
MSYSDDLILKGFELLTEVPMDAIGEIGREIKKGANPMPFKKKMAFEIVKMIKGEKEARKGQEEFERVFQKKEAPTEAEKVEIKKISLESLVKIKAASSKSEAKRLMEQGAVKVNGEKITDWQKEKALSPGDLIQVGPRKFYEAA